MRIRARSRTALRAAVLAALVTAGIAGAPRPGWAADGLTTANPGDGAALASAPTAVILTFSAVPDLDRSHVSTREGDGPDLASGPLVRSGATGLRTPVAIRSAGNYTVAYHVEFQNGTDEIGVLRFSVGTGVPPPALTSAELRDAKQDLPATHSHRPDFASSAMLVLDALVVAGVLVLLVATRRPGRREPDDSGEDPGAGSGGDSGAGSGENPGGGLGGDPVGRAAPRFYLDQGTAGGR